MLALVSAELLKLRTTRTWWGFLLAIVLLSLGLLALQLSLSDYETETASPFGGDPLLLEEQVRATLVGTNILSTLLLILGVVGTSGEVRHNTITPTYLVTPRRERVLVAKVLAYALAGLALGAIALLVTFAVAIPWLAAKDVSLDYGAGFYAEIVAGGLMLSALSGAIGVAVGGLLRIQVVAVVTVLVVLFVVEPVLLGLAPDVGRFTVGGAGEAVTFDDEDLAWWAGALVLVGWTVVLGAAAALIERRRDIT